MEHDASDLVAHFQKDGFVLVDGFLSQSEVDELDRELERFIKEIVPRVAKNHVYYESTASGPIKHLSVPERYDDYFKRFLRRRASIELLEACLGTSVEPVASEVFYKPARVGSAAPYHQDNAYLHYDPPEGIILWIALDDTTIENGAVHFAKGAHKRGDLPHFETNVELFSKGLCQPPDLTAYPEVPAILKRGDASIHNILTPHRSGPNKTDHSRRGVVCDYKGANAKVDEKREAAHKSYVARIGQQREQP